MERFGRTVGTPTDGTIRLENESDCALLRALSLSLSLFSSFSVISIIINSGRTRARNDFANNHDHAHVSARKEKFLPRDRDVSLGKIASSRRQWRIFKKANLSRALIASDRTHEPRHRPKLGDAPRIFYDFRRSCGLRENRVETSELGKSSRKYKAAAANGPSRL